MSPKKVRAQYAPVERDPFSPGGRSLLARVPWPVNLLGAFLFLFQVFVLVSVLATLLTPT
ncbi:hypothetical protein LO762_02170 [Actinocorallia sp. API 0066]|uniref:hypothetical protein n=1 Tax=Actinocorallia sp. API 0066 TaxID=2896846 RepID=UPI001E574E71|nr:hypothetical protein [Actinocorallia sp. API 0066]MCD0448007.1 hypothetical protein [Actinocorallia sp. API 0066]